LPLGKLLNFTEFLVDNSEMPCSVSSFAMFGLQLEELGNS